MITGGPPCGLIINSTDTLENGCPCASDDLWLMSNKLAEENLTLTIIGIEPNVTVCDDFYSALAKNTGKSMLNNVRQVFHRFRRRIHSIDQCKFHSVIDHSFSINRWRYTSTKISTFEKRRDRKEFVISSLSCGKTSSINDRILSDDEWYTKMVVSPSTLC